MPKITPPKRYIFASEAVVDLAIQYGTNDFVNFNDINYLNQVDPALYKKGIEGIISIDGIKGIARAGDQNTPIARLEGSIADYIRPHIIDQWDETIKYNLHSLTYDDIDGKIYRSLVQDNIDNLLTDPLSWQYIGLNIDNYLSVATTTTQGVSYSKKQIQLSFLTNTQINYTAGSFDPDDGSARRLLTSGTLTITGIAANTIYYIFAIANPTTNATQIHFDLNFSAPTLPSGFTLKKYIGSVNTNGASQIYPFKQNGNYFKYLGTNATYSGRVKFFDNNALPVGAGVITVPMPAINNIIADIQASVTTGATGADAMRVSFAGSEDATLPAGSDDTDADLASAGDASRDGKLIKKCACNNGQIQYSVYNSLGIRRLAFFIIGYFDGNI